MPQHNIFHTRSPDQFRVDNVPLSPKDNKPIIVNKPSNFSIEHILNSSGTKKNNHTPDNKNDIRKESNNAQNCFLMGNNSHQYPPILDWLQYTRYRPPRLPRKFQIYFKPDLFFHKYDNFK